VGATYMSKPAPLTIFHLSVADAEEPARGWISVSFDIGASAWLTHATLSQDWSGSAFSGLAKIHENGRNPSVYEMGRDTGSQTGHFL
jgi:hypothetical protein